MRPAQQYEKHGRAKGPVCGLGSRIWVLGSRGEEADLGKGGEQGGSEDKQLCLCRSPEADTHHLGQHLERRALQRHIACTDRLLRQHKAVASADRVLGLQCAIPGPGQRRTRWQTSVHCASPARPRICVCVHEHTLWGYGAQRRRIADLRGGGQCTRVARLRKPGSRPRQARGTKSNKGIKYKKLKRRGSLPFDFAACMGRRTPLARSQFTNINGTHP
eukprot:2112833-Rhodomonas_salina.4